MEQVRSVFAAQAAIVLRQFDLRRTLEKNSAELASKVEQLEALGLLGRETAASGVCLDVGLFGTHKGMTVSLRGW